MNAAITTNWHAKSQDQDLFFCVTPSCRVITFLTDGLQLGKCPTCFIPGSLVRREVTGLGTSHPLAKTKRGSEDSTESNNV